MYHMIVKNEPLRGIENNTVSLAELLGDYNPGCSSAIKADCSGFIRAAVTTKAPCLDIKEVIYNPPATIVLWKDGTKTVVKCGEYDKFDSEKGLAMAIAKKSLGNKGSYYRIFREHVLIAEAATRGDVDNGE